jgi:thiamine-phosphate pyrophosphorylase
MHFDNGVAACRNPIFAVLFSNAAQISPSLRAKRSNPESPKPKTGWRPFAPRNDGVLERNMTDFIKPRLYLITPPVADAQQFAPALTEALGAGDVACVLLRFAPPDENARKKICRALAPLVQEHEAALLVLDDSQLAVRAGADGVHVNQPGEIFAAALESLKPERIVGLGGLPDRDAAMSAGDQDVDYLMFGDLDPGGESADAVLERVAWWAEIFNVPCIGVAHDLAEVEALAKSGAEFVALGASVFDDPRGPAAAVTQAQESLDRAEASA